MNAIFNTKTSKFKTYDGWTELEVGKKGTAINGLQDVMLFTEGERKLNVLPTPLEWRHINPRVNWRMFK
jgi:hypothetical protein